MRRIVLNVHKGIVEPDHSTIPDDIEIVIKDYDVLKNIYPDEYLEKDEYGEHVVFRHIQEGMVE